MRRLTGERPVFDMKGKQIIVNGNKVVVGHFIPSKAVCEHCQDRLCKLWWLEFPFGGWLSSPHTIRDCEIIARDNWVANAAAD